MDGHLSSRDIRCDDVNMIMGVERKWAPTMMKLEGAIMTTSSNAIPEINGAGGDDSVDDGVGDQQG